MKLYANKFKELSRSPKMKESYEHAK